MKRRIPAICRVVTLVAVLFLYGLSTVLHAEAMSHASETAAFSLDMKAKVDSQDAARIDVFITVKDIKQELDAIEFILDFDPSCVRGEITENGEAMDAFMTVKPMYTLSISGMEIPASRYEQICAYDVKEGRYICRFLDKLHYASAKPGESYNGLINDGDLVITVPFRILPEAATTAWTEFRIENVKGTTRDTISGVKGTGDQLWVQIGEEVPETKPTVPEISEDTTVESSKPEQKPNESGPVTTDPIITEPEIERPGELLPLPESTQGSTTPSDQLPPPTTNPADQPVESPTLPEAAGEVEVTVSVSVDTDADSEIMPVPQETTGEQAQQSDSEAEQAPSVDNEEEEEPSQTPKLLILTVITVLLLAAIVCLALILWKHRK